MRSWKLYLTLLALVALVALVALLPVTAEAKKNDPNIPLAYTPTTEVAEATAVPTSRMRTTSASILISDDRGLDEPRTIGTRTDDDDNRIDLVATSDVAAFVEESLADQARQWNFSIAEPGSGGVVLVGRISQLSIEETNQAVGATYNAEVTFEMELRDAGGETVWSGSAFGDASRYGKKFSRENTNEVLSDALAEALANALGDPALRSAWGGAPESSASAAASAASPAPLSPEKALLEVEKLMSQDMSESTIEAYLREQTLTRALGADDLAAWKQAGVPEPVLRTAMTLPVK